MQIRGGKPPRGPGGGGVRPGGTGALGMDGFLPSAGGALHVHAGRDSWSSQAAGPAGRGAAHRSSRIAPRSSSLRSSAAISFAVNVILAYREHVVLRDMANRILGGCC